MAVYKVPQDVESEDKLLGPFTFRQFIYLIIVAMGCGVAFLLFKISIVLVVLPLPIIVFFGILAIPIKKDQSMEVYLGGLLSFYILKPRKRLWKPDGVEQVIEITAPKDSEPDRVKHLTQDEASRRLDYLTDIVESRGWAVRGVGVPTHGVTSMNNTAYHEAQNAPDLLDNTTMQAQRFNQLIQERDNESRERIIASMQHQQQQPPQVIPSHIQPHLQNPSIAPQKPSVTVNATQTVQTPTQTITPQEPMGYEFNPYPQIHQSVVKPLNEQSKKQQHTPARTVNELSTPTKQEPRTNLNNDNKKESTSENTPSPDIIKLANESEGLTVADVAHQAQRLEEKHKKNHGLPEGEVEISLH